MAQSSSPEAEIAEIPELRRLTPRGQARRARILNAAIRLMWRDGYAAVGIDTILKEAGTQKGSFYHLFPSKADLLLACLDHLWGMQRLQLAKIVDSAPTGRAALTRHVEWTCEAQRAAHLRYGYVPGLFHMSIGATGMHQDPRVAQKIKTFSNESTEIVRGSLERIAQQEGLSANPDMLADIIASYIGGAVLKARVANDIAPVMAIPAMVDDLLSHFVKNRR